MRHTGSIRERSDGSFQVRYSTGYDPLTGKRKRVEVTVEGTYKDAEKELRRLLRAVDTGEHVEPSKMTVSQFLTEWLKTMKSQISPKTHERYSEIVNNYLIPTLGNSRVNKLTPLAIQNAYDGWETKGRRDKKEGGLAPRTRLHIHRIFKSSLKHALRLRLIPFNPADLVMAPRAKKTPITTLTMEQSGLLLDAARPTKLYWPVLLAITTGMRRGEIAALRWRNVDFDKSTLRVVESVEQVKQNLRFKATKTETGRAVMLPSRDGKCSKAKI